MESTHGVTLSFRSLPSDGCVVFRDSSFFKRQSDSVQLPSPDEVRSAAALSNGGKYDYGFPDPVRFERLNLFVKFGHRITIAEGQCLWAIRHLLKEEVPVPEVFGWCRDKTETFIYMDLVRGETLEHRWDKISLDEKESISDDLGIMVKALRRLKQDPSDARFIGHIGKQPLQDIIFEQSCRPPDTFPSVAAFHDWFTTINLRPDAVLDPARKWLSDEVPIVFTHGDIHRRNIMVSFQGQGKCRIVALVDWHQSGWLPAYWEFCKALITTPIGSDWETDYIPRFLSSHEEYKGFEYFIRRLGM